MFLIAAAIFTLAYVLSQHGRYLPITNYPGHQSTLVLDSHYGTVSQLNYQDFPMVEVTVSNPFNGHISSERYRVK